jgi:hypothetical protein
MAVFVVTGLMNELLPAGTPLVASATPNSAAPGQLVTVTLSGVNTHFVQGVTQVVAAGVAPNPTSIVVLTNAEEAVLPNGFVIQ